MAKAATAQGEPDKKKKKARSSASGEVKAKKATKKDRGPKKDGTKARSRTRDGIDGLAKLVDHPLVADLLAAGAIAAVAAIAEHQMSKGQRQTSSRMVKSVGKAAAAAMGKKLLGEFSAIAGAASGAAKKG